MITETCWHGETVIRVCCLPLRCRTRVLTNWQASGDVHLIIFTRREYAYLHNLNRLAISAVHTRADATLIQHRRTAKLIA